MNLLAHFYLSRFTPPLIVGSFLGDFVKGKRYKSFEPDVVEGILLHREIDYFTDFHPTFLQSKHRLVEQHRHYSGVIVDIFYDHFLAKNWSSYSGIPLEAFTQQVYQVLQRYHPHLPLQAQRTLSYMQQHNWLKHYAHLEGISRTLSGMEKRSKYPNQMGAAVINLQEHYPKFEEEFTSFFTEVIQHSRNWLNEWKTESSK